MTEAGGLHSWLVRQLQYERTEVLSHLEKTHLQLLNQFHIAFRTWGPNEGEPQPLSRPDDEEAAMISKTILMTNAHKSNQEVALHASPAKQVGSAQGDCS